MPCYRDMTFCRFYEDCKKAKYCHRPLTEEVKHRAEALNLYICEFTEKPECWENTYGD